MLPYWLSIACARPPANGAPTTVAVACVQPGANVLRWSCTAEVAPPQALTIRWERASGADEEPNEVPLAADEHTARLHFLRAATTYRVTAEAADGARAEAAFTTGPAPANAVLDYTIAGTPTARRLLHASPCAHAGTVVVSATDGEVVWYEQVSAGGADILNARWTEDDTVLVLSEVDGVQQILEVDWDGDVRFVATRFEDFERTLHHDVVKHDGRYYAINNHVHVYDGLDYWMSGFYVFDADGTTLADWDLADHVTPPPLPGGVGGGDAVDYAHANAIEVDDGEVTLSLRHLSALIGVRAEGTAADYGPIAWRLSGNPETADLGSDYALTASAGGPASFVRQHHGRKIAPDRVALFDNRDGIADSRVVEIALDDDAGTADIDRTYDLGVHCDYQGGVYYTAAGDPLATCGPQQTAYEFDAGSAGPPRFTLEVRCPEGQESEISRFVPLPD